MRLSVVVIAFGTLALAACSKGGTEEQSANTCGPSPSAALISQKQATDAAKVKPADLQKSDDMADTVGYLSWNLCNARANGWVDDAFYRNESLTLRRAAFAKLGVAAPDAPADTEKKDAAPSANEAAAGDDVAQDACLKAAHGDAEAAKVCTDKN